MRRGSPLPIPNREVKPDCADGTAVMWESMSLPFFSNPDQNWSGLFFYRYSVFEQALGSLPFFRKSFTKVKDFFLMVLINQNYLKSIGLSPLNIKSFLENPSKCEVFFCYSKSYSFIWIGFFVLRGVRKE